MATVEDYTKTIYRRFRSVCACCEVDYKALRVCRLYSRTVPLGRLPSFPGSSCSHAVWTQGRRLEGLEIVHGDIMGFPFYAVTELGDWDIARQTRPNNSDGPTAFQKSVTPGHKTPISTVSTYARKLCI